MEHCPCQHECDELLARAKALPLHGSLDMGKNVFTASLWMVGITIALFFLPLVNGLIGGAVGGYKAGDWKRALVAAVIPAILVGVLLWILLIAFELPVIGLIASTAASVLILVADVGIFVGALLGGIYAQSRQRPAFPA